VQAFASGSRTVPMSCRFDGRRSGAATVRAPREEQAWDNSLTEPARLVIQGSYAENVIFDYHQAFYRELSVLFPRDNQARDIEAVSGSLRGTT